MERHWVVSGVLALVLACAPAPVVKRDLAAHLSLDEIPLPASLVFARDVTAAPQAQSVFFVKGFQGQLDIASDIQKVNDRGAVFCAMKIDPRSSGTRIPAGEKLPLEKVSREFLTKVRLQESMKKYSYDVRFITSANVVRMRFASHPARAMDCYTFNDRLDGNGKPMTYGQFARFFGDVARIEAE